jgi:hypothetical protein
MSISYGDVSHIREHALITVFPEVSENGKMIIPQ